MSPKLTTSKNLILAIVCVAQLMDILDMAIVNVALPSIYKQLHFASLSALQWITSAYVLTYGGFLILGGRAADLFGRKRVFIAGTILYALASLGTGASQSGTMIELFRGLQGLSAAFMSPAALSIILTTFTETKERNRVLGIWGGIGASGAVIGAILGGIITTYVGWRWNFFINIFIGVAVALAAARFIPSDNRRVSRGGIDFLGALFVTGGLLLIVYALTQVPTYGWSTMRSLIGFGGGVILLVAFVLNEAHSRHPLVPANTVKIRNLVAANVTYLLSAAAFAAIFFFPTLYMQNLLHFTPLRTGLSFLPLAVSVGIMAGVISKTAVKIGYKLPMILGAICMTIGLLLLTHLPLNGSYAHNILPGFIVVGLGVGAVMVASTIAATGDAPDDKSGLASSLFSAAQQIGFALGLALLSGVAIASASRYAASHLTSSVTLSMQSQVHGYNSAFYAAAGITVGCAIFALLFVRQIMYKKRLPMTSI